MQTIQERINWLNTISFRFSWQSISDKVNGSITLLHALVLAPPVYYGLKKQHAVHNNASELPQWHSGHGLIPFLGTFGGISAHLAVPAAEPLVSRAALYQLPRRRRNFPGIPGPALERGETDSCRGQVSIFTRQCVNGMKDSQNLHSRLQWDTHSIALNKEINKF